MICHINTKVLKDKIGDHWKQNCDLIFKETKIEYGKTCKAEYKNMSLEIFEPSNIAKISGSLHYLFNDGCHNWNDFNRIDLFDTIHSFCNRFGFELQNTKIQSFEFGVNIQYAEPTLFIKSILAYKTGNIHHEIDHESKKDIVYIHFGQYTLKIYNKGSQFDKGNILRVEVKIRKMDKVKKAKVTAIPELETLNDLLKIPVLEKLGKFLLNEFDGLIISEPIDTSQLTDKELIKYKKLNDRKYWEAIIDKDKRRDSKEAFKKLMAKYGNGMHKEVSLLISQKWKELLAYNAEVASTLLAAKTKKVPTFLPVCQINNLYAKKTLFPPFDHLANMSKGGNIIQEPIIEKIEVLKKCSNCKKVLKIGVVKYCDLKCELQRLSRNKRSNPNHTAMHQLQKLTMQPTLFKQWEYLKIDPLKIDWLHQQGFNLQSL